MSIPFNKLPCVQDDPSEVVAANDTVADSVDLDLVDAISVLDPAEVVAAIDVLDIAEAVAVEGDLDHVDVVAIGMTEDVVDSPDLALVFAAILVVLDPGKAEVAIAVGFELTDDNFDLPFALKFKDFENVLKSISV